MNVTDVPIGLSYNAQRSRVPLDITVLTNLGPAQTLHVPFAALIQQKEKAWGAYSRQSAREPVCSKAIDRLLSIGQAAQMRTPPANTPVHV